MKWTFQIEISKYWMYMSGVIVAYLECDSWFKPQPGQTKDYQIDICCFLVKHTALRSKSKNGFGSKSV